MTPRKPDMLEYQLLLTRVDNGVNSELTASYNWKVTLVCLHADVVIRGLRALSFN